MFRPRTLLAPALCLALLLTPTRPAGAQSDGNATVGDIGINYVYAAQLGFGGYSVGGVTANVYTLPLRYTFEDVIVPTWDLSLLLPLQYGNYRFKTTLPDGSRLRLYANTLAAIPGVELKIPIVERWQLKPFAQWGFATAFEPDSFTYIYGVGVRSLIQRPWGDFTFGLGNAVIYAGNADLQSQDGDDESQAYGSIETGLEARHPLGFRVGDREPQGSLFFIYYWFFPDLEFDRAYKDPLRVQNQFEVGFDVGSFLPWKFAGLDDQRVGVSYRFGEFDAIRVNLGFPF